MRPGASGTRVGAQLIGSYGAVSAAVTLEGPKGKDDDSLIDFEDKWDYAYLDEKHPLPQVAATYVFDESRTVG